MSRLSEIEERCRKAIEEVNRLCEVPGRKWQMRVPVDLETDSDVLIGTSLADIATLLRLVRAAKAELHSVRNYLAIHAWDVGGIDAWLTAVDEEIGK